MGAVLEGRSSVVGGMLWMLGLSFLGTLLLGWIPVVGPFVGPVVGGYVGGRRIGTPGGAVLAAILPAILLGVLILALGAVASVFAGMPVIGGAAALLAGMAGLVVVLNSVAMIVAAAVGGATRD